MRIVGRNLDAVGINASTGREFLLHTISHLPPDMPWRVQLDVDNSVAYILIGQKP